MLQGLEDEALYALAELQNLEELSLVGTDKVTGNGLNYLSELKKLKVMPHASLHVFFCKT